MSEALAAIDNLRERVVRSAELGPGEAIGVEEGDLESE